MGEIRAYASRRRWTEAEEAVLRQHYSTAPMELLERMLPERGRRQIQCKANGLGLIRAREPRRTPDQTREAKRLHMAKKRAANPEAMRLQQRQWVRQNRDRLNERRREWHGRRFFHIRAKRMPEVTAQQLWSLWKRQRGICALSGQRLDRSAELDHKLPQARGGVHSIDNLQWVSAAVNRAKRDLTDEEFLALCQAVVRWIGRRIAGALA